MLQFQTVAFAAIDIHKLYRINDWHQEQLIVVVSIVHAYFSLFLCTCYSGRDSGVMETRSSANCLEYRPQYKQMCMKANCTSWKMKQCIIFATGALTSEKPAWGCCWVWSALRCYTWNWIEYLPLGGRISQVWFGFFPELKKPPRWEMKKSPRTQNKSCCLWLKHLRPDLDVWKPTVLNQCIGPPVIKMWKHKYFRNLF